MSGLVLSGRIKVNKFHSVMVLNTTVSTLKIAIAIPSFLLLVFGYCLSTLVDFSGKNKSLIVTDKASEIFCRVDTFACFTPLVSSEYKVVLEISAISQSASCVIPFSSLNSRILYSISLTPFLVHYLEQIIRHEFQRVNFFLQLFDSLFNLLYNLIATTNTKLEGERDESWRCCKTI